MGFFNFLSIGLNTTEDGLSLKYDTTGNSGIGWLNRWWKASDRVQKNLGIPSDFTEAKTETDRINVAGDGFDLVGRMFPNSSIAKKIQHGFNRLYRPDLIENANPGQEKTPKSPNLLQRLFYRKKSQEVLPAHARQEQANHDPIGLSQRYEAYPPNEHIRLTPDPTPLPSSKQCMSR